MAIVDPAETKRAELAGSAGERASSAVQVSVVLPCLNEEETVAACVEKARGWFQRSGVRGEVLVVDNGSTDHSAEEARRAGARVIVEPRRGKGRACHRGFEAARGRIIVLGDADATYDFSDIGLLTEPLSAGYDMVIGNRLDGVQHGAMTWTHRRIGNPLISLCVRLFSGMQVSDSLSGFRAFTREAYECMELRSGAFEIECEMILRAATRGLRIKEVAISYYARQGETKLRTFSDGWRIFRFLLLNTPNYLFLIPGAVLLLAGILSLALNLLAAAGVSLGTLTWQPVFAGGVLLVVGTNALMIGMVAKVYAASRGVTSEGRLTRFYRRYVTLERMLLAAAVPMLLGLALGALGLYEWLNGDPAGEWTVGVAAAAQSSILVGANLALGGLLIAIIEGQEGDSGFTSES